MSIPIPPPPPALAALHWQYPQAAAVVLPLMLALTAYTVWSYVPQIRQVGRPWAWTLPGLRVAAFAVLAGSLLRPAVTRPRTAAERGPVAVLIDTSLSMGVTDTGRPPGPRVAVAAAVGRLPADARDAAATAAEAAAGRLGGLADDVARARSEVEYARVAGRSTDAAAARLDAAIDLLRQGAGDVADAAGPARTPPLERALGLLSTVPTGVARDAWLDQLGDQARAAADEATQARAAADARLYDDDPAVRAAADAVAGRTREQLAWAAACDPRAGLLARIGGGPVAAFAVGDHVGPVDVRSEPPTAAGVASDLAGGVRAVVQRLSTDGSPTDQPPRAVVLLSDGRQVGGPPAESAAAAGVPVFTVDVADPAPSPNLAVTDLVVPPFAYPGEPAVARATLVSTGPVAGDTDVTFTAGGGDRQVRHVVVPHDGGRTTVSFTWTPKETGPTLVSVRAAPVAGEATDADNVSQGWTAVVGSPVRVAVFAPSAGPALDAAQANLLAAPGVQLTSAGVPTAASVVDQVNRADVVVLFDVTGRLLTPAGWEAINRLVGERGGGAVLVAGEGGVGPGVLPATPLGRLLPFARPPPPWEARPLGGFQPAPDAPRLTDDPTADDSTVWAALPPLAAGVPGDNLRADARPLVSAGNPRVPWVVERPVGAGRVLWVGANPTTAWRSGPNGGRVVDRFWTALVRRAAGDPYAIEAGGVAVAADEYALTTNRPIRVRLRLPEFDPTARPPGCRLRVLAGSRAVRTIPFRPVSVGRYDLFVNNLPPGEYTMQAEVNGVPGRPQLPLHVGPTPAAELADLSGDPGFLHRLADATGGQAFRLDQLDALARRLAAPSADRPGLVERPLWDSPYLFAGVLGLLTVEWAVRRQAGLA